MSELVLIRGLPGSGKTTLALLYAEEGYKHFEADHYFMRDAEYIFYPDKLGAAHKLCFEGAAKCMDEGVNCVVSNTFTRRWEMQNYIDHAHSRGVSVKVIVCRGRFKNVHGVPEHTIARMTERWED